MKTPQVPHGVIDAISGEEITTPLGVPRNPEEPNPYDDKSKTEAQQDAIFLATLGEFSGSDTPPKRHFCVTPKLGMLLLSEGADYLRNYGGQGNGCHWLFDIFVTEIFPLFKKYPDEDMLIITITVKNNKASLSARAQSEAKLWSRHIGFTDLIDMDFYLWMLRGDNVAPELAPGLPAYGHVLIPKEY
jgi:hypothetical protein